MVVHQLVPCFTPGDAMGQAALHFQLLLRRLGHAGEVYAHEVAPALRSRVLPARALRPRSEDLVLYHHGIASSLSGALLHLPCRKGLVFHNVTPARFYEGTLLHEALVSGRAQLSAVAPSLDLAIGVSELNAAELLEAGSRQVHVVPLFIEPRRFQRDRADPALLARLSGGPGPTVVSVSRVVPHKRFEDLLALHAELRRLEPEARLLLVGGFDAGSDYFRALSRKAVAIGGVELLGRVDHGGLVAAYRSASVFVSMSEHEGFGVPLVEAMAAEVPVLAFAAAAVPMTLAGRGVAFTEKRFAALAELTRELARDDALRARILRGQKQRLRELSDDAAGQALARALASLDRTPAAPKRHVQPKRKPRVAFVVQRFGEEISGGAEAHARAVAMRLAGEWSITVLTTCAKDHLTWVNELPSGSDRDGPLEVIRFPSARPRRMREFNRLSRSVFGRSLDRVSEEHWVAEQGPLVPELLGHLASHADRYDGFVFFTYLYAPTVWGLPLVAKRSLVVPTAHDEPPFQFDVFADVFERPRALLCNTPEEADLIHRRFPQHARAEVVGVGVEALSARPTRFQQAYGVRVPYLLYVGRLEEGKGIGELLRLHRGLRRQFHDAPELVLAGASSMRVSGPGVRYVGRISEQEKHDALAGAMAVVVPSRYESLSLLALEGLAHGTPILVNGASDVLRGHVKRSGAGAVYEDGDSFAEGVRTLGARREKLRPKALAYARRFRWEKVLSTYRTEMRRIMEGRR